MKERAEVQFDLGLLAKALARRLWIIALAMLICGAGAFAYVQWFITPLYSATTKMYVNNVSKDSLHGQFISSSELAAAQRLVDTYIEILKTPETLNQVIEEADASCSYSELLGMITTGSVNGTEVFFITVENPLPEESERLANTIAEVLPDRIADIVEGSSVKVIQSASLPTSPNSPGMAKTVMLGAFFGLMICCLGIIVLELMDNTIRDEHYLSEAYGLQTIVTIPSLIEQDQEHLRKFPRAEGTGQKKWNVKSRDKGILTYKAERNFLCDKMHFQAAEAYKMLRTNLNHILDENPGCKVIGITSAEPAEGKSTLAINLAYSLAQTEESVLLLEGDLRKPVLTKRMRLAEIFGLSDMLEGITEDAVQNSGYFSNWDVLTAGSQNSNPAEILSSRAMGELIAKLRKKYAYILIDLPPINEVTDSVAVSNYLDGMLMVVRQNSTQKAALELAMHHLKFSAAEALGFVVTDSDQNGRYSGYYRYGYNRKRSSYDKAGHTVR